MAPPHLWGGGAKRRRGCDQSTGQRRVLPIYGEVARSAGGAVTVPRDQVMDKVVALAKRRGFIFPSSEIYGGLSGFYDYGPYGVALKRASGGPRVGGLPAARDRAGDVRRLQERHQLHAGAGAVRHRPAGQGVPERDHTGQLCLPRARVRADGDGVLRPPEAGRRVVRVLAEGAAALVHGGAWHSGGPIALPRPSEGVAVALLEADHRHRVRVSVWLGRAGR